MADQMLEITASTLMALQAMLGQPKFVDHGIYHPPSEEIRRASEVHVNELLRHLIETVQQNPRKSYVLSELARTLKKFDNVDSEEQDRVAEYMEEIMDIFHIESSDGLLNTWRYGFDPAAPK